VGNLGVEDDAYWAYIFDSMGPATTLILVANAAFLIFMGYFMNETLDGRPDKAPFFFWHIGWYLFITLGILSGFFIRHVLPPGVGIAKFWTSLASFVLLLRVFMVASLAYYYIPQLVTPYETDHESYQCSFTSRLGNHLFEDSQFFFCPSKGRVEPLSLEDKQIDAFQVMAICVLIAFQSRIFTEVMFPLPILCFLGFVEVIGLILLCKPAFEVLSSMANPETAEIGYKYVAWFPSVTVLTTVLSNVLFRTYLYRCRIKERLANLQAQAMKNQVTFLRGEANTLQDKFARTLQKYEIGENDFDHINRTLISIAHLMDSLTLITQIELGEYNFNPDGYIKIRSLLGPRNIVDSLPIKLSAIYSDDVIVSHLLRYLTMHGAEIDKREHRPLPSLICSTSEQLKIISDDYFSMDIALALLNSDVSLEEPLLVYDALESPIVTTPPGAFTVVSKDSSAIEFAGSGERYRFFLRMRVTYFSSIGLKEQSKISPVFDVANAMAGSCGVINILVTPVQEGSDSPTSAARGTTHRGSTAQKFDQKSEVEKFQIDYFVPCVPTWSMQYSSGDNMISSALADMKSPVHDPTTELESHGEKIGNVTQLASSFMSESRPNCASNSLFGTKSNDSFIASTHQDGTICSEGVNVKSTIDARSSDAKLATELETENAEVWGKISSENKSENDSQPKLGKVGIISSRGAALKGALSPYFPRDLITADVSATLQRDFHDYEVVVIDKNHELWKDKLSLLNFKGLVIVADSQVNQSQHFENYPQLFGTTLPFPFDSVDIKRVKYLVTLNFDRASLRDGIKEKIQLNGEVDIHRHTYSPRAAYVPMYTYIGIPTFIPRVMSEIWGEVENLTNPINQKGGFSPIVNYIIRIAAVQFEFGILLRVIVQTVVLPFYDLDQLYTYVSIGVFLVTIKFFRRQVCSFMEWTPEDWFWYDSVFKLGLAITHFLISTTIMARNRPISPFDLDDIFNNPRRSLSSIDWTTQQMWNAIQIPPYNYIATIVLGLRPTIQAAWVMSLIDDAVMDDANAAMFIRAIFVMLLTGSILNLAVGIVNIHRQDYCRRPSFARVLGSRAYVNMLRNKVNDNFKELSVNLAALERFALSLLFDCRTKITERKLPLNQSILTYISDFAEELERSRKFQSVVAYFNDKSLLTRQCCELIPEAQRMLLDALMPSTPEDSDIRLLASVDSECHFAMGQHTAFRLIFFWLVHTAEVSIREYKRRHHDGCMTEILFDANLAPLDVAERHKAESGKKEEDASSRAEESKTFEADTHLLKLSLTYKALPFDSFDHYVGNLDHFNGVSLEWMDTLLSDLSESVGADYNFTFRSDGFAVSSVYFPCNLGARSNFNGLATGASSPSETDAFRPVVGEPTPSLLPTLYYSLLKAPNSEILVRIFELNRANIAGLPSSRHNVDLVRIPTDNETHDEAAHTLRVSFVHFGDKEDSRILVNAFVVSNCECQHVSSMEELKYNSEIEDCGGAKFDCILIDEDTNRRSISHSNIDLVKLLLNTCKNVPILALTKYLGAPLTSSLYKEAVSRPVSKETFVHLWRASIEHLLDILMRYDFNEFHVSN
jgi:hypothetical protein